MLVDISSVYGDNFWLRNALLLKLLLPRWRKSLRRNETSSEVKGSEALLRRG
jgi:hypothetical protein